MPTSRPVRSYGLVVALMLTLVVGCSPGSTLPPLENFNGGSYKLGVGDQIRVITFGVEQLSATFRVNDAGDIELPLIGSFRAAGLSTRELRLELAAALEAQ